MFNVFHTYSRVYYNTIAGIEMLNDNRNTYPYFTTTNFYWFPSDDSIILISYISFTSSVALSVLKLIYDINLKFQVANHISSSFQEIINLMIVIFITF